MLAAAPWLIPATVGSCAQIGNNVHLSGGAGIGVLEPLQAGPVIIEDDCFIGRALKWWRALLLNAALYCLWGFYWGVDKDH